MASADRAHTLLKKQPFGSNSQPAAENVSSKQVQKPLPPLVPIAQFEAFKAMRLQHGRLKDPAKDSLQEGSCRKTSDSSTPSLLDIHYQDTQYTTVADSSTSSSGSSAVLNASADGISSKNGKRKNMVDSSTSSNNSSNATNQQSDNNLCRGYEVDKTFDDEDDSCKNWPFTTEEPIRILSHDNIFKGAVLSSIPEHEITSSLIYAVTNRLPISNKNICSPVTQENDTAAECNCNRAEQFEMGSHFTIPSIVREDSSSHRTSSIISADNETVVSQQNFKFKTPMLPPAKIPPKRLKSCTSDTSSRSRSPGVSELSFCTLSVSNNSDTSGVTSPFAESLIIENWNDSRIHDNDDAILLYTGIIKGSDVEDNLPSREHLKEEDNNPLHIEDISSRNNVQLKPTPLIELPNQSVTLPQSDIIKGLASGEEAIKSNPKKAVPAVFNNICYFYFTRGYCKGVHKLRQRRHELPGNTEEQIKNLSQEELLHAYNFTKDKYKLYAQTIHYFIKTFEERNCMSNVLSIVNDIVNISMFDRTPLINKIIKTLQAMNQSFCSAVEMIVAQQAPNIVLSDILLYIICVQHKDELTKNWYLVQKLIPYRSCYHIDHHLLEDIITECCCNKNKDLCKNVMKDIISRDLVELQRVSVKKMNDFLSLLRSFELEDEERILIDVMKQYNIIMQNTGLTSTPPLTSAENRLVTQNDLNYKNVSTEQLLQNERDISNEYNKNMRNSCSVEENLQQFSDCQKSNDTGVHKDTESLTTSVPQYMWSIHSNGNISNFKTDSKDYYDTTWTKNVKLTNSSSRALQFDMDEYQGMHISRELNLVSQNIEIGSSTASDNYIKSNFCENFSLTQNGIFETDREKLYQINSPDELDFAKNLNVSHPSSLISHDSSSNSITNRDVTNNMGMQYIQCCQQKIYQPMRQPHKLLQRQGADGTTKQEGGQSVRFDRKLLDFDYGDDEDEDHVNSSPKPLPNATNNAAMETVGSLLSNPEVLRQLQTLQQTMSQSQHADLDLEKLRKLQEMKQQEEEFDKHLAQTVSNLPFASECDLKPPATNNSPAVLQNYYLPGVQDITIPPPGYKQTLQSYEIPSQQEEITLDSEIQFLGGNDSGDLEVINLDDTDSLGQSPHNERYSSQRRRSRFRDRSRDRGRDRDRDSERPSRKSRSRSRSRDRRRRSRSWERDRKRDREKEKEKERRKRGLPPVKKENLSVCSTTLWVGHLSKWVLQERLSDTFGQFGDVVSIDLIRSRGCAFIVMHRRQDAKRCLQKLQNHKMQGKAITIAWAPGKGVKGKDIKDYWEVDLGVSYIPWSKVKPDIDLEMLEEGGMVDEDTMPAWLKAKINQQTSKPLPPLMPTEITDPAMAAAASTGGATIDTSQPPPLPGGDAERGEKLPPLSDLLLAFLEQHNNNEASLSAPVSRLHAVTNQRPNPGGLGSDMFSDLDNCQDRRDEKGVMRDPDRDRDKDRDRRDRGDRDRRDNRRERPNRWGDRDQKDRDRNEKNFS